MKRILFLSIRQWAVAIWAVAGTAQAQTLTFAPAATYSYGAGSQAYGMAVADVNGDGRPDLLTANYGNGTVGVLLGNANGTLRAAANYPAGAGNSPFGLAVADVNGDGRTDLLSANFGGSASVLLGNGNGTFRAANSYPTGPNSSPRVIAATDVNGDGRPDLLTANYSSNSVGVLLGNGNGTFQPVVTYPTGPAPDAIAAVDVNADNRPDIITTNSGSATASVLLGNGNGTFRAAASYGTGGASNSTASLAVADVNGDGQPDLLTASVGSGTAGVLLGNGNGTFRAAVTYSTGAGSSPSSLAVADVNGDGRPDLLTANSTTSTVGVLLGNGNGSFQPVLAFPTGTAAAFARLAAADANGDGRPDLLVITSLGAASVLLNATTFPAPTVSGMAPTTGVAGTRVMFTGTNLGSTTSVSLNGTNAPGFGVNAAGTELTVDVPTGTTGAFTVSTPGGTARSAAFAVLRPAAGRILIDGYRESCYGPALALQTTPTGFGNATNGSQTAALNGSELDAAYARVSGDSLYVFLAGNLEGNGNSVEVFFDSQAGGQNVLAANNPNVDTDGLNAMAGLTFDNGFAADYYLGIKAPSTINVVEGYFAPLTNAGGTGPMSLSGPARSVALDLGNGRIGTLAVDQSNTGGVSDTEVGTGWPAAVVTGTEVVLPLAALGRPVGSFKVAVFVNGVGHNFLSNQSLGGLPSGTANLGAPAAVNFNTPASNQYFTVNLALATASARPGNGLVLYPNPAHGTATVRWPVGAAAQPLALLDALGREVRRYLAPTGTEATLDLRGLPASLYVLRSGTSSQRLVVE